MISLTSYFYSRNSDFLLLHLQTYLSPSVPLLPSFRLWSHVDGASTWSSFNRLSPQPFALSILKGNTKYSTLHATPTSSLGQIWILNWTHCLPTLWSGFSPRHFPEIALGMRTTKDPAMNPDTWWHTCPLSPWFLTRCSFVHLCLFGMLSMGVPPNSLATLYPLFWIPSFLFQVFFCFPKAFFFFFPERFHFLLWVIYYF